MWSLIFASSSRARSMAASRRSSASQRGDLCSVGTLECGMSTRKQATTNFRERSRICSNERPWPPSFIRLRIYLRQSNKSKHGVSKGDPGPSTLRFHARVHHRMRLVRLVLRHACLVLPRALLEERVVPRGLLQEAGGQLLLQILQRRLFGT